jgi:hypothetical protein
MASVAIVLAVEILVKHVANTPVLAKGIAAMLILVLKIRTMTVEPQVVILEIVAVQLILVTTTPQANETVLLHVRPVLGLLPAPALMWLTTPKIPKAQVHVIQPA